MDVTGPLSYYVGHIYFLICVNEALSVDRPPTGMKLFLCHTLHQKRLQNVSSLACFKNHCRSYRNWKN